MKLLSEVHQTGPSCQLKMNTRVALHVFKATTVGYKMSRKTDRQSRFVYNVTVSPLDCRHIAVRLGYSRKQLE